MITAREVPNPWPDTMGQQSNKIIKRRRRADYLKRKKEQAKTGGIAKKSSASKEAAKKAPAKKAPAKKAPAKKAPAKKTAVKAETAAETTETIETTAAEGTES